MFGRSASGIPLVLRIPDSSTACHVPKMCLHSGWRTLSGLGRTWSQQDLASRLIMGITGVTIWLWAIEVLNLPPKFL